ncbi:MAG: hypothetical protein ACLTDF_13010 [Coprococcus sp.]
MTALVEASQGREYSFFTLEGSLMDPATIDALDHINKDSMDFKIIGTY